MTLYPAMKYTVMCVLLIVYFLITPSSLGTVSGVLATVSRLTCDAAWRSERPKSTLECSYGHSSIFRVEGGRCAFRRLPTWDSALALMQPNPPFSVIRTPIHFACGGERACRRLLTTPPRLRPGGVVSRNELFVFKISLSKYGSTYCTF